MPEAPDQFDGLVVCPVQQVEKGWIDYNGHMNMAFYHVLFDRALDHVYHLLGVDEAYVASGGGSCFTVEVHVCYLKELVLHDPVRVEYQLLDCDDKRLHVFAHMYHADEGYLAATSEQLAVHVDMQSRRSAPFPRPHLDRIAALYGRHRELPRPERAGRVMGIHKRT